MSRTPPLYLVLCLLLGLPLTAQVEADRAYDLAAGLHDRALHERAVRSFEGYLERWPQHGRVARARFHLADSLLALERPAEALSVLEAFMAAPERSLLRQASYALADALGTLGRPAEAAEAFKAAIGKGEDELGQAATHFAAESLAAAGKPALARRMHERLEEARGSKWRLHSLSALGFMDAGAGEHQAAIGRFDLVAREGEGELALESRLMAAASRLELGRHQEALRLLGDLNSALTGERRARAALLEGRALVALKRPGDAGPRFQAARGHGLDDDVDRALIRAAAILNEADQREAGLALLALVPAASRLAGDAQYWRGILAGASGRADEAVESLRAALKAGEDPRRRYRLADTLMRAGHLREAAVEFKAVIASGDAPRELRDESCFGLGFCLDSLGERVEAAEAFERLDADGAAPDLRLEAVFARAECLFDLERRVEALQLYSRIATAGESDLRRPASYKMAFCLSETGRKEEALRLFGELAAARPVDELSHDCALMQARLFAETGRDGEAATAYGEAARLTSSPEAAARAGLAAAALLRREGDTEKAGAAYELLLNAPGECGVLALFGLAACAADSGKEMEAARHWEVFLTRHGDHPLATEAKLGLAWARRSQGLEAEALEPLREPFADAGFEAERLFLAGEILRALDRQEEALAALRAAAEKLPEGPRATASLLNAGILARERGEFSEAAADLDRLLASEPEGTELVLACYERALVALELEDGEGAHSMFLRLEKEQAGTAQGRDAIFRLAEEDYASQRWRKALGRYQALLGSDQLEEDLRDRSAFKRAFTLEKLKSLPAAFSAFAELAKDGGRFALDSAFAAGDLAIRLEAPEEALEYFERAWALGPQTELGLAGGRRALALLAGLGRNTEVVKRATGRLDLEARDAWSLQAMMAYADAQLQLGETRAARHVYEIVADHGSAEDAARARWFVGRSLAVEGQGDEAVEAFLAVTIFHERPAWSARALLAAAEILAERREPKKSRALLEDLLRDHPKEGVAPAARALLAQLDAETEKN